MAKYFLRRILLMIPIMLGVSLIVYIIMSFTPNFDNPGRLVLGMEASEEAVRDFNEKMGADKSFSERYINYIGNVFRGDFGVSYRSGLSIGQDLLKRFPITLTIALISILLSLVIGVPVGILSAVRQYKLSDYFTRVVSMMMTAIPSFWLGLMFLLLFALKLKWFHAGGIDDWSSYVLPSVSLSVITMGLMIRMTRSTMLEVIRQDYIRTARSKGLTERRIIFKHALRNALIPIITVAGNNFGNQLGGAVIIESVFAVPGVGTYILTGVNTRDMPCVLGSVLLLSLAFSLINLLVDIAYTFVDPRIKAQYTGKGGAR